MSTICGIDKLIGEKDGAIGWITFNNPARHNAVSMSMWQALFDVVSDFAADDAIRVVVRSFPARIFRNSRRSALRPKRRKPITRRRSAPRRP
jgi:hypothetical protein